jgi:SHS2 domain-containing protein
MSKGYEYLEHTADVYIKAVGKTLEEAFENAGRATTDIMTDIDKVESKKSIEIRVEAENLDELLYLWLEEIIFRFDVEALLLSEFEVKEIAKDGTLLKGEGRGEEFNPDKHPQRLGIKAATFHMMDIKLDKEVSLKFVLDV